MFWSKKEIVKKSNNWEEVGKMVRSYISFWSIIMTHDFNMNRKMKCKPKADRIWNFHVL